MFACIYGRSVSKSTNLASLESVKSAALLDLAFTFSPLVEQTRGDTVVLDISGQNLLFGLEVEGLENPTTSPEMNSGQNIATEIYRRGQSPGLEINVAVAANPDASIHAARSFKGVTLIPVSEELSKLGSLSIKKLDSSLAAVEEKRAAEIQETFTLWGIRTFGDLARLPLAGVAERLGQDGVKLQKLAEGKTDRNLNLVRPPIGFEQSIELEHPVSELEPLSFILSRLLNQLCANLLEYALATNELKVGFVTERCSEYRLQSGIAAANESPTEIGTLNAGLYERTITLPVPMRNPKTLLRLLLFEIERKPPQTPIIAVTITGEPVKPRASQTGLFIPLAPEPERLEITLARLAKLAGPENVGSPEILDSYRPDSFRMKRFTLNLNHRGHRGRNPKVGISAVTNNRKSPIANRQCVMAFRIFRPPWRADVRMKQGTPTRIDARSEQTSSRVHGRVVCSSGPWRASGDWWRHDVWARDEWDVAVLDSTSNENEILCRIYRDLTSEQWFVAGIYD